MDGNCEGWMLDGLDDGAKDGCPEGSIVEGLAVGDVEGIDDGAIDDPTVGFPVGQKLLGVRLVWRMGRTTVFLMDRKKEAKLDI